MTCPLEAFVFKPRRMGHVLPGAKQVGGGVFSGVAGAGRRIIYGIFVSFLAGLVCWHISVAQVET